MSLIRTGLILAAVVMLLPVDEKKQTEFTATAASTADKTATFCTRNPSTCEAGRDLWALFLRKAEYGMELGAKLVRDQLTRPATDPGAIQASAKLQPAAHQLPSVPPLPSASTRSAQAQPARQDTANPQRQSYPMDFPSRWR